jgi:hypothetical protein
MLIQNISRIVNGAESEGSSGAVVQFCAFCRKKGVRCEIIDLYRNYVLECRQKGPRMLAKNSKDPERREQTPSRID